MSEQRERQLIAAVGQLAHGFEYDEAVSAFGNLLLNALRQKHPTLEAAQNQLEALQRAQRESLRRDHYRPDGSRNDRRIVVPSLSALAKLQGA